MYEWFKNHLIVLGPSSIPSSWGQFIHKENIPTYSAINKIISKLDTGITHLDGIEVTFESIQFPEGLKAKISEDLSEGDDILLGRDLVISKKMGYCVSKENIVSYHKTIEGKQAQFDLIQESEGTLRMIELLPAIVDLSDAKSNKTYVIDEFDHSMHTMLVRSLLEYYFQSCSSSSRSQLLFTTHNLMLMDQDLFRRDEVWITERNLDSSTQLLSLVNIKMFVMIKIFRKKLFEREALVEFPKILLEFTLR